MWTDLKCIPTVQVKELWLNAAIEIIHDVLCESSDAIAFMV